MGWFSTTIMGGDTPMDFISVISDVLKPHVDWTVILDQDDIDNDYYNLYPLKQFRDNEAGRESVKHAIIKLDADTPESFILSIPYLKELVNDSGYDSDYANIFLQVACSLYMACGAPIPEALKEKTLEVVPNDEWAQDDKERRARIKAFLHTLSEYDNETPRFEQSEGLFQKVFEKLEGKPTPADFAWSTIGANP